jgi:hypothetical protein
MQHFISEDDIYKAILKKLVAIKIPQENKAGREKLYINKKPPALLKNK